MKVLIQHRTQGRNAEGEHISGIAKGFIELGHEVAMVEPLGVNALESDGLSSKPLPEQGTRSLLSRIADRAPGIVFELLEIAYNLFEFPRMLVRLRRFKPQMLYSRYSLFTFAPSLAARICGVPLVLEVNDATFITRSRPLHMRRVATWIERWIFRSASLWITISTQFAQMADAAHPRAIRKVLVLPNAVTPGRFPDVMPSKSDALTIGVVAAFTYWHGVDFLIDALPPVFDQFPNARVILIGDGSTRPAAEEKIRQMGYEDSVRFTGFVPRDHVPVLLREVDVCLIPDSNVQGSPVKLFEYCAAGKPTVAPAYPPIEEVVKHGETALLFAPRDRAGLSSQIISLLADGDLRARIGRKARALVMSKHTWVRNVERTIQAFHSITKANGSGRG